jgi:hypothetical protein
LLHYRLPSESAGEKFRQAPSRSIQFRAAAVLGMPALIRG